MVSPALFLVVNRDLKGSSSSSVNDLSFTDFAHTFKTICLLTGTLSLVFLLFFFSLSFHPVSLGEWRRRTQYFSLFLLKETISFYSEAMCKINNKLSTMPEVKETDIEQAVFL